MASYPNQGSSPYGDQLRAYIDEGDARSLSAKIAAEKAVVDAENAITEAQQAQSGAEAARETANSSATAASDSASSAASSASGAAASATEAQGYRDQTVQIAMGDMDTAFDVLLDERGLPVTGAALSASTADSIQPGQTVPQVAVNARIGASKARTKPRIYNASDLARFADARRDKTNPIITVIGNSISHGVGSDGSTATTTGYHETYRQYAWPVQLRKILAARGGYKPAENFVHPGLWFSVTQNLVGGATRSASTGAFGDLSGGGLVLNADAAAADFLSTRMGKFTEVDVFWFGSGSGTGGRSPRILIDDIEKDAGRVANTGNILKTTITGLTDAEHKITVQGSSSGCVVLGVVTRRSPTGITVNRVAFPGATAAHVQGSGTTQQKQRQIDAATLKGHSDLVIHCMSANEIYNQHPLSAVQSSTQLTIDSAVAGGACVLLMTDPAVNNAETGYAIKGSDYRALYKSMADAQAHVSFADFDEVFGDMDEAAAMGMRQTAAQGGSVHPFYEGHRRMAEFLADALPGASI